MKGLTERSDTHKFSSDWFPSQCGGNSLKETAGPFNALQPLVLSVEGSQHTSRGVKMETK